MSQTDDNMVESGSSTMNTTLNKSQIAIDRFAMFNICVKDAVEKISSAISEEEYELMFGDLAAVRKNPKSISSKFQKKMTSSIFESVTKQIDSIAEEEKLEENFKQLESLVDNCAIYEGQETWRPNGNVKEHVRSSAMAVMLKHKEELETEVGRMEQETKAVQQRVQAARAQVDKLKARLTSVLEESKDMSALQAIQQKLTEFSDSL